MFQERRECDKDTSVCENEFERLTYHFLGEKHSTFVNIAVEIQPYHHCHIEHKPNGSREQSAT